MKALSLMINLPIRIIQIKTIKIKNKRKGMFNTRQTYQLY